MQSLASIHLLYSILAQIWVIFFVSLKAVICATGSDACKHMHLLPFILDLNSSSVPFFRCVTHVLVRRMVRFVFWFAISFFLPSTCLSLSLTLFAAASDFLSTNNNECNEQRCTLRFSKHATSNSLKNSPSKVREWMLIPFPEAKVESYSRQMQGLKQGLKVTHSVLLFGWGGERTRVTS